MTNQNCTIEATDLSIHSQHKAKIGKNNVVHADSIELVSTGGFSDSHAMIGKLADVWAVEILLQAPRLATIGRNAVVIADTQVQLTSTGNALNNKAGLSALASVEVTNGDLFITSGNVAKLARESVVTVPAGEFHMHGAGKCVIAKNVNITALTESGNCLTP